MILHQIHMYEHTLHGYYSKCTKLQLLRLVENSRFFTMETNYARKMTQTLDTPSADAWFSDELYTSMYYETVKHPYLSQTFALSDWPHVQKCNPLSQHLIPPKWYVPPVVIWKGAFVRTAEASSPSMVSMPKFSLAKKRTSCHSPSFRPEPVMV